MKIIYKSVFLLSFLFSFNCYSQDNQDLIVADLLRIADGFADPAANSVAYQANGGWFSSAQSMDPWQFEVSVHGNAVFVPNSRKNYIIDNLEVLTIRGDESRAVVPTAFGSSSEVVFEGVYESALGDFPFDFEAIEGIDKSLVGHPFAQITVGLPAETEFAVRLMPAITVGDVKVNTYGAGVKHNFSQYLRFNEPEDFQFSAFVAYSLFDIQYEFTPLDLQPLVELNAIEVDADVWVAELLGSKRYADFEIFGALGVASSNFAYMMEGSGAALSDINSALGSLGDSEAQFKGDIGFNIYLNRFKISTMATAGRFFNLNLGLHFRI
ncbi:DUF6588 family protein [Autumnicola musiva]|uniref:DUF6588 family protein n=1 Tax=Autumnicola musiva TaxID=3075589 RepID=A0ABU3D2I7_9FLAO|nr:DUF6588 family protein [Zunongwangia sp. F117]MDT0675742.1 DUF6588 family protein [Zunongwangia sp. F117]